MPIKTDLVSILYFVDSNGNKIPFSGISEVKEELNKGDSELKYVHTFDCSGSFSFSAVLDKSSIKELRKFTKEIRRVTNKRKRYIRTLKRYREKYRRMKLKGLI